MRNAQLYIGRDPESPSRLLAWLTADGQQRLAVVANDGVPQTVSRCIPKQSKAHCQIAFDDNGEMTISQLREGNVTAVDGLPVDKKHINPQSHITLGLDNYPLDMAALLQQADKMYAEIQAALPKVYSISHLQTVYEAYETGQETIQRRQQALAKRRMLPIIISGLSSVAAPLLALLVASATLYATVPFAVGSLLIYLRNYREKDTSIEDRKRLDNELYDTYVCPNPDCKRFLGKQPYKLLRQVKKCPYCGAAFKS